MSPVPAASRTPGTPDGPGSLQIDGGKATIVFRRLIRHPIEEVWAAVTELVQIAEWFLTKVQREDGPGGRIVMEHPNGVRATGRVREWYPPRIYEYEWNLPSGPNHLQEETSIVRWELTPSETGTLLVLTQLRLTRPTAETFVRGLSVFLDRLSAHLDGVPLPQPPWVPRAATGGPEA